MTELPKVQAVTSLADNLAEAALSFTPGGRKYSTFTVPKRDGKTRQISAPTEALKSFQRSVVNALYQRPASRNAHGFVPGRGTQSAVEAVTKFVATIPAAARHLYSVVSIDLSDFFGTVKMAAVKQALRDVGLRGRPLHKAAWLLTYDGKLPQGSPASPALANAAAEGLDKALQALVDHHGGCYVRYADDLTVVIRIPTALALRKTVSIIERAGFTPHPRKRRSCKVTCSAGFEVVGTRIHAEGMSVRYNPVKRVRRNARGLLRAPLSRDLLVAKAGGYLRYIQGHTALVRMSRRNGWHPVRLSVRDNLSLLLQQVAILGRPLRSGETAEQAISPPSATSGRTRTRSFGGSNATSG